MTPVNSASGDGLLTWTLLSVQPLQLTVRVSDESSSSLFSPILRICNCLNGGTCQYDSVAENHLRGRFQVRNTVRSHHRPVITVVGHLQLQLQSHAASLLVSVSRKAAVLIDMTRALMS